MRFSRVVFHILFDFFLLLMVKIQNERDKLRGKAAKQKQTRACYFGKCLDSPKANI
jgi:hypothetical protein